MTEMMETLQPMLARSSATAEFKHDVAAYASYQDAPRITTASFSPVNVGFQPASAAMYSKAELWFVQSR